MAVKNNVVSLPKKTHTPPIDKEQFWTRFQGLEDIAKDVVQEFIVALPKMMTAIETAIQTQDASKLELTAHTLKGAVSNFYAKSAENLAFDLEKMGKTKNFTEAYDLFKDLTIEVEQLIKALPELLTGKRAA